MNMNNLADPLVYYYDVGNFHATIFKYTKGKSCVVCEKKSVDTSLPQDLTCTYSGEYFHSSCSDTFSAVSPENLGIIKDLCVRLVQTVSTL